ncbi:MAG TPA: 30S ribosomal protein S20 [Erysipelotrichaceae bacterium]|nr:30S ribosomal protein S20 [Erysipelotrichaceae bacterium]
MPNIKSNKKRAITNIKANAINKAKKSALKTAMKKVFTAVADKNKEEATAALNVAFSKLDNAVVNGVHHRNYSRRQKARLAKAVNSIE